MSQHKITATRSGTVNEMDWENEYTITFEYRKGSPAVHTLRNGDPGYPADPPEIEFISITPDAGDHGAFSDVAQKWLEQWAREWLDENFDDALAVVDKDMD